MSSIQFSEKHIFNHFNFFQTMNIDFNHLTKMSKNRLIHGLEHEIHQCPIIIKWFKIDKLEYNVRQRMPVMF